MRIDTSEPALTALFEKGQVGLIRTEFMRKDDVIADLVEQNAALAAENERLRSSQLSLEKWIACEQVHFETANNLREKLYKASVQIERLQVEVKRLTVALKTADRVIKPLRDAAAKKGESK